MAARLPRVRTTARHPATLPHRRPFSLCAPSGCRGLPRGLRTRDATARRSPAAPAPETTGAGSDPAPAGPLSRQQEGKARRKRRALRGLGGSRSAQTSRPRSLRRPPPPRRRPGDPPQDSPGPGTPADLPLALAPTVSAAAPAPSPAAPLTGAPCRRNRRRSRPAPPLGEIEAPRQEPEEMVLGRLSQRDGTSSKAPFSPAWALIQVHGS